MIIPCIKDWVADLEEFDRLKVFKMALIEKIGLSKDANPSEIVRINHMRKFTHPIIGEECGWFDVYIISTWRYENKNQERS